MQPDPKIEPPVDKPQRGGISPLLPAAEPPVIGAPPSLSGEALPPLLPPVPAPKPEPMRRILAGLLSVCLALFLADAALSLLEGSLSLLFRTHLLTTLCGLVGLLALPTGLLLYGLMGLTPMIPKRLFLPVALFNPATLLGFIPVAIYHYGRMEQIGWIISFCQLILGVAILWRVQGGLRLGWPLVPERRLGPRPFTWRNLCGFLAVNLLVLLPAILVYLAVCASLAVQHSSGGFLALRPGGFTVQVRQYVRDDGKTILLAPMAHIGEADFYRKLSQSFPTNSVVLMEGVTDHKGLLTNGVSYKRVATSLGLAEQQKEFKPVQVEMVRADIDVDQFTTNTLGLLNLVMFIQAKGLNAETLPMLFGFSAPPDVETQFFDDIVRKRNQHLLEEIQARLSGSQPLVVPWGAYHMPGIAEGIKASGFRLGETREYTVIHFHFPGNASKGAGKQGAAQPPN